MVEANSRQDAPATETLDVVVVGGSQAGLVIGWHLTQLGLSFVILEAGPSVGHVWRSRWDSLKLFTPAQYDSLPGMAFPAPADTYPGRDQVADYLETYAATFHLPVKCNARVTELTRVANEFEVRTDDGVFRSRQVVVATGPFQVPFVPAAAAGLDRSVTQIHSAEYRNPNKLPEGPVLVVGGGNSGFQIAEELAATRKVNLSISRKYLELPQRLMGKDLFWWLDTFNLIRIPAESRIGRRVRARGEFIIGTSSRKLKRMGVRFRTRAIDASARSVNLSDGTSLDVNLVIWATGYRSDYSWIHVPEIFKEDRLSHRRGVTDVSGLYFLGLSWQHSRGSALLGFVDEDAIYLMKYIGRYTRELKATRIAALK